MEQEFEKELSANGYAISKGEIKLDGKVNRLCVNGEKKSSFAYQVSVDSNGVAVGWWRSFKDNICKSFVYKPDDTSLRKSAIIKIKKDNEEKIKKRLEAEKKVTAKIATHIIENSPADRVSANSYIKRKGILPINARRLEKKLLDKDILALNPRIKELIRNMRDGVIVLPVKNGADIYSIQFIFPDGAKLLLPDGLVKGNYLPLYTNRNPDLKRLIFCEGWATGCSIAEATGYTVIVCFNAGNIKPVVEALRPRYKDSEFIIAADNDFETEAEGKGNTGIKAARAVEKEFDCSVIYPEKIKGIEYKDYNDIHKQLGITALQQYIEKQLADVYNKAVAKEVEANIKEDVIDASEEEYKELAQVNDEHNMLATDIKHTNVNVGVTKYVIELINNLYASHITPLGDDWIYNIEMSSNNKVSSDSAMNIILCMENMPELRRLFCYNEFTKEMYLLRQPPWIRTWSKKTFKPRLLQDKDLSDLTNYINDTLPRIMQQKTGIRPRCKIAYTFLYRIVFNYIKDIAIDPVQTYFNRLQWDGIPRLQEWLHDYCGASNYDDRHYVSMVGEKWLIGLVKRVLQPGCKFDYILVLEGRQGFRKSTFFRELATIDGFAYFEDTLTLKDLGQPSAIMRMQRAIIVEFAELTGFARVSDDQIKQRISGQEDSLVMKYDNCVTVFPRHMVFAATINPDGLGYLKDTTGNRRFLPVRCTNEINLDRFRENKEQLLAEAKYRLDSGVCCWINSDYEERLHQTALQKRLRQDAWDKDVKSAIETAEVCGRAVYLSDVLREIGLEKAQVKEAELARINSCFAKFGYRYDMMEAGWIKNV